MGNEGVDNKPFIYKWMDMETTSWPSRNINRSKHEELWNELKEDRDTTATISLIWDHFLPDLMAYQHPPPSLSTWFRMKIGWKRYNRTKRPLPTLFGIQTPMSIDNLCPRGVCPSRWKYQTRTDWNFLNVQIRANPEMESSSKIIMTH